MPDRFAGFGSGRQKIHRTRCNGVAGVPLLSIEDSSQYRLEAFVAESHSKLVQIGAQVNVQIDTVGGGDIAGTVSEVLPTTDAASRSYMVKIDLPRIRCLRRVCTDSPDSPSTKKRRLPFRKRQWSHVVNWQVFTSLGPMEQCVSGS
jgi:hypothetical protein